MAPAPVTTRERIYNSGVARPAHRPELAAPAGEPLADEELLDPTAIERRYRMERARRRARERHQQETSLARVRFLAVLGLLVTAGIVLLVVTWDQVQRLFGL
jgi:hypothetical protein